MLYSVQSLILSSVCYSFLAYNNIILGKDVVYNGECTETSERYASFCIPLVQILYDHVSGSCEYVVDGGNCECSHAAWSTASDAGEPQYILDASSCFRERSYIVAPSKMANSSSQG